MTGGGVRMTSGGVRHGSQRVTGADHDLQKEA
jgi:hypothetical protein